MLKAHDVAFLRLKSFRELGGAWPCIKGNSVRPINRTSIKQVKMKDLEGKDAHYTFPAIGTDFPNNLRFSISEFLLEDMKISAAGGGGSIIVKRYTLCFRYPRDLPGS